MVGLVSLLATIVLMSVSDLATMEQKPPISVINVRANLDTTGILDIKIQHKGGDRLYAGDWWISIVPVGESPSYKRSTTDLSVGDQIISVIATNGIGNYTVTNSRIITDVVGTAQLAGGAYDVKIILYPYESMVLDNVVDVR
jgi:hypothetical protein